MDISGLEDEFLLSEGKPRLIYIKEGDEREPKLAALLERVGNEGGVSYKRFRDGRELETLIEDDLSLLLTERFLGTDVNVAEEAPGSRPNLPAPVTPFIGRDRELRSLEAHIEREDVRLTTLTGPGGVGKTRLAIQLGYRAQTMFDGVHFVPLAPIREPELVPGELAKALEVRRFGSVDSLETVRDFLAPRRDLLILDNFEQVLEASTVVAQLLAECSLLKIMVTSRAPLQIRGEYEFYVQTLELPRDLPGAGAADYDAVKLFVERAQAVRPDFELSSANADAVVQICRRLDGLPLAIELAAARIRILTPELLLAKLDEGLRVLSHGARDMPDRHQRLRDTIEWSYELLDEDAKTLLARLGVFRGGFTLEAAEEICSYGGLDVLSGLSVLIDQSLVRSGIVGEGEPRFMMLETIREFATELLGEDPNRDQIVDRHARLYAELTRVGGIESRSKDQIQIFNRMEREIFNMRAAASWLLRQGEADVVAEAMIESWFLWWTRGYLREARLWTGRILDYKDDLSTLGYGKALALRGVLAYWQNDHAVALPSLHEASEIFAAEDYAQGLALCDVLLGLAAAFTGDVAGGQARLRKGIQAFLDIGDRSSATTALNGLCWTHSLLHNFEGSEDDYLLAMSLSQEQGTSMDIGMAESNLGTLRFYEGDEEEGIRLLLSGLNHLARLRHISIATEMVDNIAQILAHRGRHREVLVIFAATEIIRERVGAFVPFPALERVEETKKNASAGLPEDEVEAARAEGRKLDFDAVVALAMDELEPVQV